MSKDCGNQSKREKLGRDYFLIVLTVMLFATVTLHWSRFYSQSNDSKFYGFLVERISDSPQWMAPKWEGSYARIFDSPIRDQFLGHVFLGALITKLGVHPHQSLHLLNILFFFMTLWWAYQVSLKVKSPNTFLFFGLSFMSITLMQQIRGNHEPGLTFFMLMAAFAPLFKHSWAWFSLGATGVLLIKGILVVLSFPLALITTFFFQRKILLPFLVGAIAIVVTALVYEWLYFEQTGLGFLQAYYQEQISGRTLEAEKESFSFFKNFFYYFGRLLAYSAPLSLVGIFFLIKKRPVSLSKLDKTLLFQALFYLLFFSFFGRTASRYIYPAYFLIGLFFCLKITLPIPRPHFWGPFLWVVFFTLAILQSFSREAFSF